MIDRSFIDHTFEPTEVRFGRCYVDRVTFEMTDCDDGFKALSGITKGPIVNLFAPEDIETVNTYLYNMSEKEVHKAIQATLNSKKGPITVLLSAFSYEDRDEMRIRIEDISAIKNYERELCSSLLTVDALLKNVNGGGYSCFVNDETSFNIITSGLPGLFGYDEKTLREKSLNSLKYMIYEADRNWVVDNILGQLQVDNKSSVTYRVETADGQIKWVNDVGHIVKTLSGQEMLFGTVTDVTDVIESKQRLTDANYELETLMTNIPGGICVFEYINGKMVMSYANEEYYILNGYTSEYFYIIGDMDISRFVNEDDYKKLKVSLEESLPSRVPFEYEYKVNRPDEIPVWVSMKAKVFKYHNDNPVFYSVIWDTTQRKLIENELYLQTERYRVIEENIDEVPFDYIIHTDTLIVPENRMSKLGTDSRFYNFNSRMDTDNFVHKDFKPELHKIVESAKKEKKNGKYDFLADFLLTGEYIWYRMHYATIFDGEGKPVRIVGRIKNINEEKIVQQELERQLKIDSMTGLYNKNATEEIVGELIENACKNKSVGAMIVVDIDNFKLINDAFGHTFGDTVIENFAASINSVVYEDTIVGRVGGDEFLLYLNDATVEKTQKLASDICTIISKSYVGEQMPDGVSCSIGIAYAPKDGKNFQDLFIKADLAMYHSKADGKNRFTTFSSDMKKSAVNMLKKSAEAQMEIAQREKTKEYDVDFVTFSFSLLAHSKDIDSSINILLERIGKRYDLSFVAVLEDIADKGVMQGTNLWRKDMGITAFVDFVPPSSNSIRYITPKGSASNIYSIKDTRNMSGNDKDVGTFLFSAYNIQSCVTARFVENNLLDGCLCFCDCNKTREWTAFETGTFSELSRITSVFVSLRRERNKDLEKIKTLSSTDALTGLLNQGTFVEKADSFIKEKIKKNAVALIYTDINNFSYVNENFGYEAGDRMLCDFAKAISKNNNTVKINCRIYSDYFLTVSTAADKDIILEAVNNVTFAFIEQQKALYPASNINLSTGIYFIEDENAGVSTFIENANLARKAAKLDRASSNYVYDEQLSEQRAKEQTAANDLHKAINTRELQLYLQPKFSLSQRKAVGAESLVRWVLPDGSKRYPNEFIPILERIGYIVELDYFIYEETLRYIKKWLKEGKTVEPISVNFARQHLKYTSFVNDVHNLTKKYKVPPEYIELEITESESIRDNENFIKTMEKFRKLGYTIDIDDFGTGYSSLSMLLDAPFDVIKIDKSFISKPNMTERDIKYLATLVELIKSCGKDIIFEGVETEEQASYLFKCGCDKAQGFLFSRAISADEYEELYVK